MTDLKDGRDIYDDQGDSHASLQSVTDNNTATATTTTAARTPLTSSSDEARTTAAPSPTSTPTPLTTPEEQQDGNYEHEEEEDIVHPLISEMKRASSSGPKRVSWDASHFQSESRSKQSARSKVSMRQVLNHSPYETEVETYIQLSMDETDAESEGASSAQTSILGHVPLDVPLQTFRVDKQPLSLSTRSSFRTSTASLSLHGNSEKRKLKKKRSSTAEDLYRLTRELEQFQPVVRDCETTASNSNDDGSLQNSFLSTASIVMKNEISSFRKHGSPIGSEHDLKNTSLSSSMASKQSHSTMDGGESKVHHPGGVTTIIEEDGDDDGDDDDDDERVGNDIEGGMTANENEAKTFRHPTKATGKRVLTEFKDFEDWLRFKRSNARTHVKVVLFFLMLPATGIAAILFYLCGNPPTGISTFQNVTEPQNVTLLENITELVMMNGTDLDGEPVYQEVEVLRNMTDLHNVTELQNTVTSDGASSSWWLLFICCRQAVTFTFARATNSFVVNYLALQTRWLLRAFGPCATLFVVQSRGWPCILFCWGLYDLMMLYGSGSFARHWLFYQDKIELFNDANPSGSITSSSPYLTVLVLIIIIPFLTAIKRFFFGLIQAKQTFLRYSEELARIMDNALLISETAKLSRHIEMSQLRFENFDFKIASYDSSEFNKKSPPVEESNVACLLAGFDTAAKKARVNELLGAWEGLEANRDPNASPDIADVLQFRHSLSYLGSPFPFGTAFGPMSSREECIESAEAVYNRLLQSIPGHDVLIFDVLAMLAISKRGELREEKLHKLIKLFRPDREGRLTVLDFVKSIDTVNKKIRLLRVNVANSSKLDRAAENLFNVFFFIFILMIAIASFGLNPFTILVSVTALIAGFSLMISTACSNYLQGLLFILVQRPYEIGNRINVGPPGGEVPRTGSRTWIVQDINLFSTTIAFGPTREVATISNGALATSRIINAARSHNAQMNFNFQFPVDTPYAKLKLFKTVVQQFIKARPREWVCLISFRCIRVEADLGFVEYIINARHREAWQQNGAIKQSRADLSMFIVELSKKMGMRYQSPPKPVDLTVRRGGGRRGEKIQYHSVVDGSDETTIATAREDKNTSNSRASLLSRSQDDLLSSASIGQVAQVVAAMFDTELPAR